MTWSARKALSPVGASQMLKPEQFPWSNHNGQKWRLSLKKRVCELIRHRAKHSAPTTKLAWAVFALEVRPHNLNESLYFSRFFKVVDIWNSGEWYLRGIISGSFFTEDGKSMSLSLAIGLVTLLANTIEKEKIYKFIIKSIRPVIPIMFGRT